MVKEKVRTEKAAKTHETNVKKKTINARVSTKRTKIFLQKLKG